MAVLVSDIAAIPVFSGISEEGLKHIASLASIKVFAPNRTIIQAGDNSTDIYFLLSGSVSARAFAGDGKEVSYTRIDAPQYFGEFSALDNGPRSANIETLTDAVVVSLTAQRMHEVMMAHPQVAITLLRDSISKNRKLTERVFEFSTMPVAARIRREIWRLAHPLSISDEPIELRPAPSHYEIAARTNTHREAVSRELGQLVANGIIMTGRKAITILEFKRLDELVQRDRRSQLRV